MIEERIKQSKGFVIMKKEKLAVIKGSDNPFRDVGLPDANTKL